MGKRKYAMPKEAMDAGSPMLAKHFNVVPRLVNPTTLTMKIIDQTETDKLLMMDAITSAEHGTLATLARRLREYGYDDLKSPAFEGVIGGSDPEIIADKKADKIRGAVALIDKLDKHPHIGRYRRKKLVNLALYDAPWGDKRNQIEELKFCIRALDDIFVRR